MQVFGDLQCVSVLETKDLLSCAVRSYNFRFSQTELGPQSFVYEYSVLTSLTRTLVACQYVGVITLNCVKSTENGLRFPSRVQEDCV